MIIYVDIDETICNTPADRDYEKSTPIAENIEKINILYDEGRQEYCKLFRLCLRI